MEQYKASALVAENMKTIFAYSLSRVSHKEDAEDLAGDIVAAILSCAPRIKNDDAFFGYIWAIAANTYKNFLRSKKRAVIEELDEDVCGSDGTDVDDDLCAKEELYALRQKLSLLSREYRECTVAYYIDGLSCAEVSRKLNISPEMVKYYLFKTRKILKEGIGMAIEYGQKSYNPGIFHFRVVFKGMADNQYCCLFQRKLPGNILLSAYYTPMTVRELSIELGVSAVYMEDEIALLEKYNLIKNVSGCKYQTNLIIYTLEYVKEMISQADKFCVTDIKAILASLREALPAVRNVGFRGSTLSDNRLLWSLYVMTIFNGIWGFNDRCKQIIGEQPELYRGAYGIAYGSDHETDHEEYYSLGFAGRSCISDDYIMTHTNFSVFGSNCVSNNQSIQECVRRAINDHSSAEFPINTKDELDKVMELLKGAFSSMTNLFEKLAKAASDVMRAHAPKLVADQIETVVYYNILFQIMGYLGAAGLKTGELQLPQDNEKVTLYCCMQK